MHLTREALDVWAASSDKARHGHVHVLRLEEGDSMASGIHHSDGREANITGPAIVELIVYRDGGWSAREMTYETPESIALAASLAQRQRSISIPLDDPNAQAALGRTRLRRILGRDRHYNARPPVPGGYDSEGRKR